jgi:hypothetical protein
MHKSATKCNKTLGKWCKNKHGASKIIDTLETYQPTLMDKIREAQKLDKEIEEIKSNMSKGKAKGFCEDEQGTVWFEKRVCVPQDPKLRRLIMQEAHDSPYSIRPGNTKMYMDLKGRFWWSNDTSQTYL